MIEVMETVFLGEGKMHEDLPKSLLKQGTLKIHSFPVIFECRYSSFQLAGIDPVCRGTAMPCPYCTLVIREMP
jgi:hypothetical protein